MIRSLRTLKPVTQILMKQIERRFSAKPIALGVLAVGITVIPAADTSNQATSEEATGELVLGAPGVGLNYKVVHEMPFAETAALGRYYKFTFTGIEVQADADGVPGTYPYDGHMWDKRKKSNNGHGNNCDGVDSSNPGKSKQGLDSDPTVDDECIHDTSGDSGSTDGSNGANPVPGWWEMWAQVNDIQTSKITYSTSALHQLSNTMQLFLATPVVFREQTVTLNWAGNGNSKDPDGHFFIMGSAIKEPPVPIGKLEFDQNMYLESSKPPFSYSVVRE